MGNSQRGSSLDCCKVCSKPSTLDVAVVKRNKEVKAILDCPFKLVEQIPEEAIFNVDNEEEMEPFSHKMSEELSNSVRKVTVHYGDNLYYSGSFSQDWEKDGFGTQLSGEYKYTGYFANNLFNGKGRLVRKNGFVYEGDFSEGEFAGKGKMVDPKKNVYEGFFVKGQLEGYGKIFYSNGDRYEGSFQKGKRNGMGTLTLVKGENYIGEFKNNNYEGFGECTFKGGNHFKGQWRNNKMNGVGKFSWKNGKFYFGEYFNDCKEGVGVFYWAEDLKYIGHWKKGEYHGTGVLLHKGKETVSKWDKGKKVCELEIDKNEVYDQVREILREEVILRTEDTLINIIPPK